MVRRRRPKHDPGVALLLGALEEDRYRQDRTTLGLLPQPRAARAVVLAQAPGVVSGVALVARAVRRAGLRASPLVRDGGRVRRGVRVLELAGDARRILAVERTVLNVLMHASGVATETARAVAAANPRHGRRLEIWATRKTLPGLRELEKAAVEDGGGHAHRRDLAGAILVKNNHLALVPLPETVARLRRRYGARTELEVEVRSVRDALRAARLGVGRLLVDNAPPARARAIVRALERAGLRSGRWVEISGGLTARNLRRYASVGADAASLGSLTHSAAALPFHLRWVPARLSRRSS